MTKTRKAKPAPAPAPAPRLPPARGPAQPAPGLDEPAPPPFFRVEGLLGYFWRADGPASSSDGPAAGPDRPYTTVVGGTKGYATPRYVDPARLRPVTSAAKRRQACQVWRIAQEARRSARPRPKGKGRR